MRQISQSRIVVESQEIALEAYVKTSAIQRFPCHSIINDGSSRRVGEMM
jgi:hypothetical protein